MDSGADVVVLPYIVGQRLDFFVGGGEEPQPMMNGIGKGTASGCRRWIDLELEDQLLSKVEAVWLEKSNAFYWWLGV